MPCYPLRSSRGFRPDPFLQIAPELQLRPDGELDAAPTCRIFCNRDVDVIKNTLGASFGPLAPEPSAAYQPLE